MNLPLKPIFGVFLLLTLMNASVAAQCTTTNCPPNQLHVCSSENTFLRCANGQPIQGMTFTCPPGTVCVNTQNRCEATGQPVCKSQCSVCDPTNNIACITQTKFAFCIGNKPDLTLTGTCTGQGEKCVANNQNNICVPNGVQSCEKTVEDLPTPPPDGEITKEKAIEKCKANGEVGKFATNDCQKYIYCFAKAGQITGNIYKCPGTTQFDCNLQQCTAVCVNSCPKI